MLLYDISCKESLAHVKRWHEEAQDPALYEGRVPQVLLGKWISLSPSPMTDPWALDDSLQWRPRLTSTSAE